MGGHLQLVNSNYIFVPFHLHRHLGYGQTSQTGSACFQCLTIRLVGNEHGVMTPEYQRSKCDRILENHPYGCKWHSKYLALKSSIQH